MKLKYMIRGIGIGAVFTAALMYFLFGRNTSELSDEEIMQKARELGMMTVAEFKDKELNSLKDRIPAISELTISEEATAEEESEEGGEVNTTTKDLPSSGSGITAEDTAGEAGNDKTGTKSAGSSTTDKTGTGTATKSAAAASGAGTSQTAGKSATGTAVAANSGESKTETVSKSTEKATAQTSEKTTPKTEVQEEKPVTKVTITVSSGMSSERVASALQAAGIVKSGADFNKFLINNGYSSGIRVGSFVFEKGQTYAEIAKKLTGR